MERVRRLSQFWNYLPAFRAVAENQHLPTAAREFGSSPPGLSRSIHLLEEHLDQPLFHHLPRRLELNQAGHCLLQHLREAMRRIDDGVQLLQQRQFTGPLRISASHSASLVYVLPALQALQRQHARLVPEILSLDNRSACDALHQGRVDLALIEDSEVDRGLHIELLDRFSYGIFMAANNPFSSHDLSLEQVLEYGFVAAGEGINDQWPAELQRNVRLRVSSLPLAIECCAKGDLLALLPDQVGGLYTDRIKRLPIKDLAQNKVLLVSRRQLGSDGPVVELSGALRKVVAGLGAARE